MTVSGNPGPTHKPAKLPWRDAGPRGGRAGRLSRVALLFLMVGLGLVAIARSVMMDAENRNRKLDDWIIEDLGDFARALRSDDPSRTHYAKNEARRFGRAALGPLLEALRDPRPHVRADAANGLGHLAEEVPEAASALFPLLDDPVDWVRRQACATLGEFGPAAKGAVGTLTRMLQDHDRQTVSSAAIALGHIGPAARSAAPQLFAVLKKYADGGSMACYYAVLALDAVGDRDRAHVPVLVAMLDKCVPGETLVPQTAAAALGGYAPLPEQAIEALRRCLLREDEPSLQVAAAVTLVKAGEMKDEPIDVLVGLLGHEDPDVRQRVALNLGWLGVRSAKVISRLRDLLKDGDEGVRDDAAAALEELGEKVRPAGGSTNGPV